LQQGQPFINTSDVGYNSPVYQSSASDPLVTVTNTAGGGGVAATWQVHIPVDTQAAIGGDAGLTIDDTATGTWYSLNGFNRTSDTTATIANGSAVPDNGSGFTDQGNGDFVNMGTLTEEDLQSGTIDHTLGIAIPTTMLHSYDSSTPYVLAPNAWPQTQEDGFAISGNGGPVYTGTVDYGVTVGIPAGTPEPADVAANAGADMLWTALTDHGAMIGNSGGSGNEIVFTADQNVNQSDPLVQGMEQYGNEIFQHVEILANQGPNSVNGGGTPIVPLDPPLSDGGITMSQGGLSFTDTGTTSTSTTGGGLSATVTGGTNTSGGLVTSTNPVAGAGTGTSSGTTAATPATPATTTDPQIAILEQELQGLEAVVETLIQGLTQAIAAMAGTGGGAFTTNTGTGMGTGGALAGATTGHTHHHRHG
jgi:hypothetical protein